MIYSAKAIANEFDCDAKRLRKFLRSNANSIAPVGKGARYAIDLNKSQIRKLRSQYDAWSIARSGSVQSPSDAHDDASSHDDDAHDDANASHEEAEA